MSEMSYLEKLLDGGEVEWVALSHVFDIFAGGDVPKDSFSDVQTTEYNIPILSNGIDNKSLYGWTDTAKIHSPSLTISARGTIGWTSYRETPFFPIVRLLVLTPKTQLNLKYAYYFMKMIEGDYKVPKTGIPQLTKPMLKDITIPIPCPSKPEKSLAIQSEIVRILDSFTTLTAELTAELAARKKQYNYYRDQLLSFKDGEVEWKTLGKVAKFRRGTAITQKQTMPGDIPVVANGPTPSYFHCESNRQDETIVIARSGAYAGYVSFWNQTIFLTDAFSVHPDLKIVKPKFIYHVLQNKQEHIHAMKKGAGVPHVRVKEFESYDVPIPHLAEQARIVSILDKFDTLTTSISEGLPREIELRQKQYEYYRNLLFSFPKPDAVAN
ncbi:MAG: restriction endonuclease subunit S [Candidatus Symbiopectobacterium sp. Dall1.0]|nr:restriction endonuclease subunit S [Candidatus Symbiopectobacterium sp. Dall1.0]